jgi:hypothetical protein
LERNIEYDSRQSIDSRKISIKALKRFLKKLTNKGIKPIPFGILDINLICLKNIFTVGGILTDVLFIHRIKIFTSKNLIKYKVHVIKHLMSYNS